MVLEGRARDEQSRGVSWPRVSRQMGVRPRGAARLGPYRSYLAMDPRNQIITVFTILQAPRPVRSSDTSIRPETTPSGPSPSRFDSRVGRLTGARKPIQGRGLRLTYPSPREMPE